MNPRQEVIAGLYRARPRSALLRVTLLACAALGLGACWSVGDGLLELVRAERLGNLRRFLERDALPYPLREGPFRFATAWDWVSGLWAGGGREGALATLWIASSAIVLAAALGALLALLGSRVLAWREPFVSAGGRGEVLRGRAFVAASVRLCSVLARALPEYVLAFLLLGLLGSNAWPAVLALALHNAGILGRLGAETVENLDPAPLAALRIAGARRPALVLFGVVPAALGRYLAYFFYRFETCVREATVLGMLGIVSLGAAVQEARARQRYDELLFLVGVAGLLVLTVDLVSRVTRRWVER